MTAALTGSAASAAVANRRLADAPGPEEQWTALAPALAASARMRVSRDGGNSYPARAERPVSDKLPNAPAAVLVYDHRGCAPVICLDLDSSKAGVAAVDRDLRSITDLLRGRGLAWFSDHSPNGGRHIYVPLEQPAPLEEVRRFVRGLATLAPSLDPMPMLNVAAGCIRPPGARHRSGGHQQLDQTISAAVTVLRQRRAPRDAWLSLVDAVAVDDRQTSPRGGPVDLATDLAAARLDALPGYAMPGESYLAIARTGDWDSRRYSTASEARQAVVWAAVASGLAFTDVASRVSDGTWPGLASLYARYGDRHKHAALVRDWRRAVGFEKTRRETPAAERRSRNDARNDSVRLRTTSAHKTQAGGGEGLAEGSRGISQLTPPDLARLTALTGAAANREVRVWMAAVDLLTRGGDPMEKAVLYALGEAAAITGRLEVEHGNRSLAIATGLDQSTVGRILRRLREAPRDRALVDLVRGAEGVHAHLYVLVVPELLRPACEKKPWRRGRIHAVRPAFRELGLPAAFIYDVLERAREPLGGRDLAAEAGLGHTSAYEALAALAAWDLAVRTPAGWTLGAASVQRLAERWGVKEAIDAQLEKYRAEREAWWIYLGLMWKVSPVVDLPSRWHDDSNEGPPDDESPFDSLPPPDPVSDLADWRTEHEAALAERDTTRTATTLRLLQDVLGAVVIS